jgi:hypothetical protein
MPITDLATNVILDNVGKVYFLKTGVYRDPVGLDNNHPLSSVSAMLIHIEDGVPQNVMLANYAPSKMASWASHDFPLWYRGQVEYTIAGESAPRTFAQYFTYVPSILVAMNKNGASIMDVNVTITQNTGANLLGGFADLTALNAEFPPTEELSDDVATAYVYDSGTKGFYRVAWNGVSAWEWVLISTALVTYGVQTKQYNVLPIKVQRGYAPSQTPLTVSDEVVRLIYQEIAYINAVIANHTELIDDLNTDIINHLADYNNPHQVTAEQLIFDNTGTDLISTDLDGAIKEVNTKANANEQDILDLQTNKEDKSNKATAWGTPNDTEYPTTKLVDDRLDPIETFKDTTVPATYETIANADTHRGRTTALETANMVKSVARTGTDLITLTKYDNTTLAVITLAEFRAWLGNASTSLAGLMSAQDKTDLDTLMALFDADGDTVVNTIAEVLAIFNAYPEGADLVSVLAGKVDTSTTVNGHALSDDVVIGASDIDLTDERDIETVILANETNIATHETRLDTIESKMDVIGLDYKEYGVREVVGQSASEFERVTRFWGEVKLGSATGLVANVAIDDADATNSFDYIPIFKREKVSVDATDLSSNTVSNTFVKVPKYYIKEEWTTEGGTDYHYIFMSQFKHEGYRLSLPFKKQDGSERDYTYIGAYEAYLDGNNKLRSLTGQIPKVSYSRNNFRTAARALDGLGVNSKYQITDLAEYVDLVQIPFMIEFATKHSQGVFLGATSMAYSASHTAVADGTAVNFIVVSNATGANFVLGQTVSIGTSNSNDSVAKDRIVTQIDVDTPNAGETTITFDGAAVNISIGNVIASRAWKTGMTDSVKVSGTHALNDGKHSIVWRGLENPFGNIWKNVDGVKISNWRGYVAENPKDYNDTASVGGVYAEPYLPLGYLNANANNYAQDLGYDANYPYAKFPISVQASSGLYFRDYYYQNTGDRTVFVGGGWADSSTAGLFYWHLNNALGSANFNLGARLSYRP